MSECGATTRAGTPCKLPAMENGRCKYHGGKSLKGSASATFKHGRYSKYMPTRLLADFKRAMNDPELLSLQPEGALLTARLEDLLRRVDTGESGALWRKLRDSWTNVVTAQAQGDSATMSAALTEVGRLIQRGAEEAARWDEIRETIDDRRRITETERRRLVDLQQMIRADQAMALFAQLTDILKTHVTDRSTLAAIANDLVSIFGAIDGTGTPGGGGPSAAIVESTAGAANRGVG